jgi:hypothetical protein
LPFVEAFQLYALPRVALQARWLSCGAARQVARLITNSCMTRSACRYLSTQYDDLAQAMWLTQNYECEHMAPSSSTCHGAWRNQ